MKVKIEINGEWNEYNLKLNESPIEISGPLGTKQWQKQKYNAKLVCNNPLYLGRYNILLDGKKLIFEAEIPTTGGFLGNVSED